MLSLTVKDIIRETEDTYTYILEETNGAAVDYEAGQFLSFLINIHGRELRRSYSISSTPGIDPYLSVTVKKVVNGQVSRFLIHHLRKGSPLIALEPAGRFTIQTDQKNKRDIFLIAAGSGITPVFSLLKKILYEEPGSRVVLITQNRSEADIIFAHALSDLNNRFQDQLHWYNFLSSPQKKEPPIQRLNVETLTELIRYNIRYNSRDSLFYTCGPLPFMRMVEFTVKQIGFGDEQVRKEIFFTPPVPAPAFELDTNPKNVQIYFRDKLYSFSLAYPSTILDAALRNNINLPFSCKAGICSTCVAQCVEGSVKMTVNEVLTEKDMERGLVLTCVGYAETDIVLQF
jgi:ring-1,2-phenylacetyl-CoA epoxidase subunit PaaE